jgi:hypothetical protein
MTTKTPESVHFSIRRIREGFELVSIENTGACAITITSVGIWFPALSMGSDFGPSRISKKHPFPGYPVTVAPSESIIYPINVGEIYNALKEKQDRITDFCYFATTEVTIRHYSESVSVEAYLRALDPNPLARKTPPTGGVFQA